MCCSWLVGFCFAFWLVVCVCVCPLSVCTVLSLILNILVYFFSFLVSLCKIRREGASNKLVLFFVIFLDRESETLPRTVFSFHLICIHILNFQFVRLTLRISCCVRVFVCDLNVCTCVVTQIKVY